MTRISSTDIIDINVIKSDALKYAETFSEDSHSLKELLLYCFTHDVLTVASCRGHKDNGKCYIYFAIKENEINLFKAVINDVVDRYNASYKFKAHINFPQYNGYYGLILRAKTIDSNRFFFSILTDLKYREVLTTKDNIDDYVSIIKYLKIKNINTRDSFISFEDNHYYLKLFNSYYHFGNYDIPMDSPNVLLKNINVCQGLKSLEGKYEFETGELELLEKRIIKKIVK